MRYGELERDGEGGREMQRAREVNKETERNGYDEMLRKRRKR